jgi:hypothetical protein
VRFRQGFKANLFKAFKAQSRLRVTGSRHSKQTIGLPYGVTEEDEKEVKAFTAQLIQDAKDPEQARSAALEARKASQGSA